MCLGNFVQGVYIMHIQRQLDSSLHQPGVAEEHCPETHVTCGQSLPLQSGNVCGWLCPPWKSHIETLILLWWYLEGELWDNYLMGMEPWWMGLVLLWRRPQSVPWLSFCHMRIQEVCCLQLGRGSHLNPTMLEPQSLTLASRNLRKKLLLFTSLSASEACCSSWTDSGTSSVRWWLWYLSGELCETMMHVCFLT